MTEVFISYNREDQAIAKHYADALERSGIKAWWDVSLRSGEAYDEVTENALRAAKAVIVLWSPRSSASRWVRAEATLAMRNGSFLPVMIEACERPIMFELTQTADLTHWAGEEDDQAWLAFLDDVRRFIAGDQTTSELVQAREPSKPVIKSRDKPSIAVLPFTNLSGDPEQAYFVDGLMEEISGALTRIRSLFVIASGSSLSLKGEDLSPLDAARRLSVRYVLQGSVRRAGDRVRISVKLVDAATGKQIWAEKYDDTLEDVFALQDKVAIGVSGVIEFSVQKAETIRKSNRPTSDLRSYDLYLRALGPFRTYTKEGVFEALDILDKAIELDEEYALALSLMAGCHAVIMQFRWTDDPDDHSAKIMDLVDRSLQFGSDDPQVVASAALAYWVAGDNVIAMQLAERAFDLNPGSSFPLLARGQICAALGEFNAAEQCIEESMRLDPFSPNRALQLAALAQTRFAQKRFEDAADLSREWAQINKSPLNVALLASSRGHLGDHTSARDALDQVHQLTTLPMDGLAAMFFQDDALRELFLEGISAIEK